MGGEGLQQVHVVVHAQLRGDGEHEGVGGHDGGVVLQGLDELVGFAGVAPAEGGLQAVDDADLVAAHGLADEQLPVVVVHEGEHAAADRDARVAGVAGVAPGDAVAGDLLGLEVGEGVAGGLGEQRRTHEVHALLGGPLGGVAAAGAPPDARRQAGGVRLDAEAAAPAELGGIRLGEGLAADGAQEQVELVAGDVGAAGVGRPLVAERLPAAEGGLGRPAGDAEGDAAVGKQVEGGGLLGEVQRVLVAHVDDAGADLDALRPRRDGRQQRHRRRRLPREMVHAEVGAVDAELVGRDGQVDGLREHVGGLVTRAAGAVVAEGQEPERFHVPVNKSGAGRIPAVCAVRRASCGCVACRRPTAAPARPCGAPRRWRTR